jgi:hypothetical protein
MELGPFNSLLSIGATGSRAQKIDLSRRRKQDHNLPFGDRRLAADAQNGHPPVCISLSPILPTTDGYRLSN